MIFPSAWENAPVGLRPRAPVEVGANTVFVKTLTGVNKHLVHTSQYFNTAEEVAQAYTFLGVFNNEVAPKRNYHALDKTTTRSVNVIVGRRARCFCPWKSEELCDSVPLYFLVQKVRVNDHDLRKRKQFEDTIKKDMCWQFVPWCKINQERPHLTDLKYDDIEEPKTRVGKSVYVGRCSETLTPTARKDISLAGSHNEFGPTIELYLGV